MSSSASFSNSSLSLPYERREIAAIPGSAIPSTALIYPTHPVESTQAVYFPHPSTSLAYSWSTSSSRLLLTHVRCTSTCWGKPLLLASCLCSVYRTYSHRVPDELRCTLPGHGLGGGCASPVSITFALVPVLHSKDMFHFTFTVGLG